LIELIKGMLLQNPINNSAVFYYDETFK